MLAKDNHKMLEVPFNEIQHHGNSMEMVRRFEQEIEMYTDVIFGRQQAPVEAGIATMYEISVAYYARAKEIEMYIKKMESGIEIGKTKHPLYKFRTGQLNVFIEMVKELTRLGSRRITVAQMMLNEDLRDQL